MKRELHPVITLSRYVRSVLAHHPRAMRPAKPGRAGEGQKLFGESVTFSLVGDFMYMDAGAPAQ